jgi:hypothetical protein
VGKAPPGHFYTIGRHGQVVADSLVLRTRQLLVAAKRYPNGIQPSGEVILFGLEFFWFNSMAVLSLSSLKLCLTFANAK